MDVHMELFQESLIVGFISSFFYFLVIAFLLVATYKLHKYAANRGTFLMLISARLILLIYALMTVLGFVINAAKAGKAIWYLFQLFELLLAASWLLGAYGLLRFSLNKSKETRTDD